MINEKPWEASNDLWKTFDKMIRVIKFKNVHLTQKNFDCNIHIFDELPFDFIITLYVLYFGCIYF